MAVSGDSGNDPEYQPPKKQEDEGAAELERKKQDPNKRKKKQKKQAGEVQEDRDLIGESSLAGAEEIVETLRNALSQTTLSPSHQACFLELMTLGWGALTPNA